VVPTVGIGPVLKPVDIPKPRKVALPLENALPLHCCCGCILWQQAALVKGHVVQLLHYDTSINDVQAGALRQK